MPRLVLKEDDLRNYPDIAQATKPTSEIAAGSWKTVKPVLNEKLAPCTIHCPLMIKIPHFMDKLSTGNVEAAARILLTDNPFASLTGRLCPAPCENVCNRANMDEAISIRELERFLSDKVLELKEKTKPLKPTGKKVAVIGSGPTGMMASYILASRGHEVTIFEKKPYLGGTLRSLIPPFKLSREILDREFSILEKMGVKFKTNTVINPEDLGELKKEYDAILILVGPTDKEELKVEGKEHVLNGLEVLEKLINMDYTEHIPEYSGRRILIFGELGTSIDLARTLIRLHAYPILLMKESVENLSLSIRREVIKAKEEGVEIQSLSDVESVTRNGDKLEVKLVGVRAIESYQGMNLYYIPISEGGERIRVDMVMYVPPRKLSSKWVEKLGIDPLEILERRSFRIDDKVFIAGSAITGPAFISESLAQGKEVANEVIAFLAGRTYRPPQVTKPIVGYDGIKTVYFEKGKRLAYRVRPVKQRIRDFKEEYVSYDLTEVQAEAERCFSCGHCNGCGNCWVFCPDNAIQWVGAPRFIYDACKGCGICANECPRSVIDMVPV